MSWPYVLLRTLFAASRVISKSNRHTTNQFIKSCSSNPGNGGVSAMFIVVILHGLCQLLPSGQCTIEVLHVMLQPVACADRF